MGGGPIDSQLHSCSVCCVEYGLNKTAGYAGIRCKGGLSAIDGCKQERGFLVLLDQLVRQASDHQAGLSVKNICLDTWNQTSSFL